MEGARVVSTTTVKAMNHQEPIHRIELTPWDLQSLYGCYMRQGVLFHKPTRSQDENSLVLDRLKNSLSRTLDVFFPLAGRLAETKYEGGTCSFSIICNNAGVEFVHAAADGVTTTDILASVYIPPIVHSFFSLDDIVGYQGVSMPLLGVQVTELVDGVFIGCTMNHVVADGTSLWHFFNSWSEISRGLDNATNLPILQRWFLDGTNCPIRFHLPKHVNISSDITSQASRERIFHFTKEKIGALKSKANTEMGTNQISSLQALLAHLCQSVFRNRHLEAHEEILFGLPIGYRPRLHPPLPNEYLGNAVALGFLTIKAGEMLERGLGYVALQLNKMIASQTHETVKNSLESWAKNPKIRIPGASPKSNTTLLMANSPRFNVYSTDFGWGRPIAARCSAGRGTLPNGVVAMFPGAQEGSVDIVACFFAEILEAMANDQEFMDAVTLQH